jgi:hypothetical protein
MEDLFKRKGTFSITDEFIKDSPDIVMKILGNMIIVRAEHLFSSGRTEYNAYSPTFDTVTEGEIAPWYSFNEVDGKIIAIKGVRFEGFPTKDGFIDK